MRGLPWCLVVVLGAGCAAKGGRDAQSASDRTSALSSAEEGDAAARAAQQLAPRLSRASAGLTEVIHPDGRRSLRVNGGFSQAQIARIDASGQVVSECVDSVPAAARALGAGAEGTR